MGKKRRIHRGPRGGEFFIKKRKSGRGTRKVYVSQRKKKPRKNG